MDYGRYGNPEANLFPHVRSTFETTRRIEGIDLWAILSWKANRKKQNALHRFTDQKMTMDMAAAALAKMLSTAPSDEERLRGMLEKPFGFRLPTATATLTVLYPDRFTIYDVRVCDSLGRFHNLKSRPARHKKLWEEYVEFVRAAQDAAPPGLSLREVDHYHWGRSWVLDAQKVLKKGRMDPPPKKAK